MLHEVTKAVLGKTGSTGLFKIPTGLLMCFSINVDFDKIAKIISICCLLVLLLPTGS